MRSLVRRQSLDTVQIFWLDRQGAVEAARQAAQALVAACPEVHQVVLFGSLADGRAVPGSDADFLVITDADDPWLERGQRYRPYLDGWGMPVDVFAYRPEELDKTPVAMRAIETGIVLAQRS